MKKIKKELKFGKFEYKHESKTFKIITMNKADEESEVTLSKAYAFSLMRFIIRVAQKDLKKMKKNVDNTQQKALSSKNNQKQLEIKI